MFGGCLQKFRCWVKIPWSILRGWWLPRDLAYAWHLYTIDPPHFEQTLVVSGTAPLGVCTIDSCGPYHGHTVARLQNVCWNTPLHGCTAWPSHKVEPRYVSFRLAYMPAVHLPLSSTSSVIFHSSFVLAVLSYEWLKRIADSSFLHSPIMFHQWLR